MNNLTENLDTFVVDFGVPVVFGAVSGFGILDMPDTILGDGLSISTEYSLIVKSSEFGSLVFGDSLTVDGDEYTVRSFKLIDDGKFGRASLQKE